MSDFALKDFSIKFLSVTKLKMGEGLEIQSHAMYAGCLTTK